MYSQLSMEWISSAVSCGEEEEVGAQKAGARVDSTYGTQGNSADLFKQQQRKQQGSIQTLSPTQGAPLTESLSSSVGTKHHAE